MAGSECGVVGGVPRHRPTSDRGGPSSTLGCGLGVGNVARGRQDGTEHGGHGATDGTVAETVRNPRPERDGPPPLRVRGTYAFPGQLDAVVEAAGSTRGAGRTHWVSHLPTDLCHNLHPKRYGFF